MTKLLTSFKKIEKLPSDTPGCREIFFDRTNRVVYKVNDSQCQSSHEWRYWNKYKSKVLAHARKGSRPFWIAQLMVCTKPSTLRKRWIKLFGKDYEDVLRDIADGNKPTERAKTPAARRLIEELSFLVQETGLRDFSYKPHLRQWGIRNNKMYLLDYGLSR